MSMISLIGTHKNRYIGDKITACRACTVNQKSDSLANHQIMILWYCDTVPVKALFLFAIIMVERRASHVIILKKMTDNFPRSPKFGRFLPKTNMSSQESWLGLASSFISRLPKILPIPKQWSSEIACGLAFVGLSEDACLIWKLPQHCNMS